MLFRRRVEEEEEEEEDEDEDVVNGEKETERRRKGCSFKPIVMARPGVRQTLYSFSNNANKRASILRFYRPALSIFDNTLVGRAILCRVPGLSFRRYDTMIT